MASTEKGAGEYSSGRFRAFRLLNPNPILQAKAAFTKLDHFFVFALLTLAITVRLYKIPTPPKVVFDEVHFGGFAQEYFFGEFFLDVHPPLAKLVYFFIAKTLGWDGVFDFANIGDEYPPTVPYVAMRLFPGLCGVATVLLAYGTLRTSCRPVVAAFGAMIVAVENSLATQSRYILLDGPLVFGLALTVFAYKKFELADPFSRQWARYLVLTGLGLGITLLVKLTGLFVVAWVGGSTILQLWSHLGDLAVTRTRLAAHVAARAAGLIAVPLCVYLGLFAVHFVMLPLNGSGSGAMLPAFRSTLRDSHRLAQSPVDVSYGSTVQIKHNEMELYLHLHNHSYKTGTQLQQVTLYGFSPDINNEWILETRNKNWEGQLQKKFRPVKDGDYVKLYHKQTGKYLRATEGTRPPISEHDYAHEVALNGSREEFPDNDYEWKIRLLVRKPHATNNLPLIKLRATESVFQLVHRGSGCVLISHHDKLPAWGFGQNEVLCVDEPTIPNSLWYVDTNSHPAIDDDPEYDRVDFGSVLFLLKVWEYHRAMVRINRSFTDEHAYASAPETWPFLLRGVNYFSDDSGLQVYLLGNLAVYYLGLFIVVSVSFKLAWYWLQKMDPFALQPLAQFVDTYYWNSAHYIAGFILHYLPFFHMPRQLFLHHYLGAVYFAILAIAQFVEYQLEKRKAIGTLIMVFIALSSIYCFVTFMPLIYGTKWSVEACVAAKWFPTWDFDCMVYL